MSTEMNNLPSDVHPDLPRNEFIQKLINLSAAELHRLRLDLFNEADNVYSLVLPELSNVPLVTRKDTAIKPIPKLSEDVWTIVSSIRNNALIPRTLFRNGKRSKEFLTQTSQHPVNITTNTTKPLPQSVPVSHAGLHLFQTHNVTLRRQTMLQGIHHLLLTHNVTLWRQTMLQGVHLLPIHNVTLRHQTMLPLFYLLKNIVRSMKSAALSSSWSENSSSDCNYAVGQELMSIKRELAALRDTVSTICQVLTTVLKNFLHTLMSLTALSVLSSHKVLLFWPVTSTLIFLFSVLHLTNRVENFLLLLTVTTYTLFHAQTSLLVQITPISQVHQNPPLTISS